MPITTNETLSSGSSDLSKGALSKGADSTGAAGVEVPVIVHASRYSSSANSVGKTLPPVHEETRTVIVFEQGAVVRLSAAVTTGEVVVLTNKLTGADVICKVGNVKAQPGIQNYVSLEFTQRAPGFWGGASQVSRAPQAPPAPAVEATPPSVMAVPALPSRPAEPTAPANSSPVVAMPIETVAAPPPQVQPPAAPVASYDYKPIAAGVAESISALPAPAAIPTAPGKMFEGGATFGLRDSSPAPTNRRPIELGIPAQSSTSEGKNIALIAVAAVVLLFAGGVAGWLLLRPSPAVPSSQTASVPAETPAVTSEAASQPATRSVSDAVVPAAVQAEPEAVSSAAAPRSGLSYAPHAETPATQPAVAKAAVQPPAAASTPASPVSVGAAPVTEASHRPVLDVGKMAAPSAKKRAATSTSNEAPPELLAQSGTSPSGSLNDTLLSASARNSGPAAPSAFSSAPAKGGQLVQPKLISSPAAIYPAGARVAHIQGDVAVDAFIDETGKVAATKVISGPPILQQAAMNAVRSWKYQPARLDGQPISIHIRVDVNFQIQ